VELVEVFCDFLENLLPISHFAEEFHEKSKKYFLMKLADQEISRNIIELTVLAGCCDGV